LALKVKTEKNSNLAKTKGSIYFYLLIGNKEVELKFQENSDEQKKDYLM
jgi:3-methyladenine DNA glycosylase Mpg